jgi:hypothetical protein
MGLILGIGIVLLILWALVSLFLVGVQLPI